MWVDVLTYSLLNPPAFPRFRRAGFRIEGKHLIFELRPQGCLTLDLSKLEKVSIIELVNFQPPRKAIKMEFSIGGGFCILVSVGKNPLAYDRRALRSLLVGVFSSLLDGVPVKAQGKSGVLRVVPVENGRHGVVLITEAGEILPVGEDVNGPGKIKKLVREFLEAESLLSEGECEEGE
ncbi:hypothetical protein [Pyrococcus yayanosii]|uniref:hypothetical protein n=1 Tax=Pyrococcus yayanosii TaxID=1008460 RepID=UPI00064F51EA|nr:hypothetical protein [Pyrococcus yayanosii]